MIIRAKVEHWVGEEVSTRTSIDIELGSGEVVDFSGEIFGEIIAALQAARRPPASADAPGKAAP